MSDRVFVHDMKNYLGIVIGYANLLLEDMNIDPAPGSNQAVLRLNDADGVLVREGPLQELLGIEKQTQFVVENASPQLLEEIERLAAGSGARIIERGSPRSSLEQLFLEATETPETHGDE